MVGGLLSSKMLALLGPAGMALTGSLRNFLTSIDTFSTLGIQNGIIKYTAQFEKEKEQLARVISTTIITLLVSSVFFGVLLIVPAVVWSAWVFNGNREFAWVFRVLGCVLPLYSGSIVFVSLLNGLGKYNKVIYLNIFGNVTGVLISALLIWKLGITGAFLGLIATPVLLLFLSIYPLYESIDIRLLLQKKYFDLKTLKNLSAYSLMSFITALLAPVVYISLRNTIINTSGLTEAGYWEGMGRLSSFYLAFVTTLVSVYFLPKLSKADTITETKSIFRSYYKIVVPLFTGGIVMIFFLKGIIIRITLTKEFLPMEKLFVWQLSGDFFRVCSFILAQEFFARKLTKMFIVTEVFSCIVLYVSGRILIANFGAEGAVMAHFVTYLVYFIVLLILFRKKVF
jgi:O-antigen/teichoic acid export membrane protein